MKPCRELLKIIEPAYAPCGNFLGACSSLRWAPEEGHVPRGFLGATGTAREVQLVLVFAEPGNPNETEKHQSIDTALEYTYQCMAHGTDLFHRNVRHILNLCFPNDSFDRQLQKTWMTESLLCSAPKEGDQVSASAWRTCSMCYLKPQLDLLSQAFVVALGHKAQARLSSIGIPFFAAFAASPPGCNFNGARDSWCKAAVAFQASVSIYRSIEL
ncbi:hypothetical protein [Pseudomonas sp. NPDC089534]|uniref:hypothetical protein n=1 Tax=Pseudomonas sp. NPDC089534 TaxID=3364468 RepID=UPI00380CF9BD